MAKGKRGRPPVGKTNTIRVPEDLHLMLTWIVDVLGDSTSATRVAEELIVHPAVAKYLELLPDIVQLKRLRDSQAARAGKTPRPLPDIKVSLPDDPSPVRPEDIDPLKWARIKEPWKLPYHRDTYKVLDNEVDPNPAGQTPVKQSPKKKRPG